MRHLHDSQSLTIHTLAAVVPWISLLSGPALAGDWPQILGPQRNGRAENEQLAESWPSAGPKVLWRYDVGNGYSGVAVAADACIVFHRRGNEAICERLDAATGEPKWKQAFPTRYVSTIAPDDGPRCVPLIHGDSVYLFGADGDLHALTLADGLPQWTRNLYQEYGAPSGYFGAGSSPVIEGNLLLVNVGGKDGHGLVAVDRNSGKTIWNKSDEQASYSSPVTATINNESHTVFVTRLNVVSVDPSSGAERFRFPFGMRGPTVNAANPVVIGDRLFVTASYGVGARLANIGSKGADIVWENDDALSSQYTTPIEHEGFLYGINGRQDAGVADLRCVDLATGKVRWSQPDFGTGNLIAAGDKLLVVKTSGELALVRANSNHFTPLATARVFPEGSVVQALPALAGGLLFARDENELVSVQVGL